jgi:membrane protein implicated in regulation of membrane protease activity
VVLWIVPTWAFLLVVDLFALYALVLFIFVRRRRRRRARLTSTSIRWWGAGTTLFAFALAAVYGGGFFSGMWFALGLLGATNLVTFAILRRIRARKGGELSGTNSSTESHPGQGERRP